MTADASVMPPVERLLALDTLTLWRVVLAMAAWGATWRRSEGEEGSTVDKPRWILTGERECFRSAWWDDGDTYLATLPNPLLNPADAWELENRELHGIRTAGRTDLPNWDYGVAGWVGWWVARGGYIILGPVHSDRKRAACLAVPHKHASGPLAPLITPLLERIKEEGLDK